MVTTGEQLPYQGQILVSNSPVSNSPVSNSPYPSKDRLAGSGARITKYETLMTILPISWYFHTN